MGVGLGVGVGVGGEESGELGGGGVELSGGLVEAPVLGVEDVEEQGDDQGSIGVFGGDVEPVWGVNKDVGGVLSRASELVCDGKA